MIDQIIDLAAEGLTDKEIAHKLNISHSTVRAHLTKLKEKYGALTRTHLVICHLRAKLEERTNELMVTYDALVAEYKARGESLTLLVLSIQKRLRESKEREIILGLFTRASHCARSFAYEVSPSNPFKCRYISDSAKLFGIDTQAILLNKTSFWECVHVEDVPFLFEQTKDTPFDASVQCLYMYRLMTPEPRWVLDAHQCLQDQSGAITGFAGTVFDIQEYVNAGLITPKVVRLTVAGDPQEPYDPRDDAGPGINPS